MPESATKVVTREVRLSYVHLLEPYTPDAAKQDPKYSVVLLIPKKDKATIRAIEAAQQVALENGKDKKFKGRIPRDWTNTFRDGDEDDAVDHEKNPEYAGHMFMTVSSPVAYPPNIVDRKLDPILDSREVYSGMYARVAINAYPFNTNGNKGVSFGLNNVQKLRDGDPLGGGGAKPEDDFDPLDDEDEDLI